MHGLNQVSKERIEELMSENDWSYGRARAELMRAKAESNNPQNIELRPDEHEPQPVDALKAKRHPETRV